MGLDLSNAMIATLRFNRKASHSPLPVAVIDLTRVDDPEESLAALYCRDLDALRALNTMILLELPASPACVEWLNAIARKAGICLLICDMEGQ
jgi:hypothetical protein